MIYDAFIFGRISQTFGATHSLRFWRLESSFENKKTAKTLLKIRV